MSFSSSSAWCSTFSMSTVILATHSSLPSGICLISAISSLTTWCSWMPSSTVSAMSSVVSWTAG